MKKLTVIKATTQDTQIIKASVDAIRSVIVRFDKANAECPVSPRVLLQISASEERFTVTLEGCPSSPATGHTIDEALENLVKNPDAAFLRNRAKTLMDKAAELQAEADQLEGIVPGCESNPRE